MGMHWRSDGALNEEGVRPGTAASGLAAPSSLSAPTATVPIPQTDGRPFLGSGRAQLAVFAAVMLGGPLGVALTVITEAVA